MIWIQPQKGNINFIYDVFMSVFIYVSSLLLFLVFSYVQRFVDILYWLMKYFTKIKPKYGRHVKN